MIETPTIHTAAPIQSYISGIFLSIPHPHKMAKIMKTPPAAYKYISSQQLRLTFDTILNPVIEHKDSFENEILVLPLPEHTVFAYRYSENAAAYYTSLTEDDIVKFFKDLASNNSFIIENPNLNNEKIMLKFTYKNTPYIVGLSESVKPKGYNLYIESHSK